ncbi:hypothetical protein NPIL_184191 [Nephila pilipes]|uniref:Uncharacterized protein n=1 Tax=Nephila pilipes TaxID=299642 RepID=A0A8X6PT75_NEPPI|nr:hypothetical protein NPIL_184191 [Nephila pilipes]
MTSTSITLTFKETYSSIKSTIDLSWSSPLTRDWYCGKRSGGIIVFEGEQVQQTVMSRFLSGNLRCFKFDQENIFLVCKNCNSERSSSRTSFQSGAFQEGLDQASPSCL